MSLAACTARDRPPDAVTHMCREVRPRDSIPRGPDGDWVGITGLLADAGGVVVLDGGADRLVAFDTAGDLAWAAGRPGGGPAEFGQAMELGWLGGGLAFRDYMNGRISRWRRSGDPDGPLPIRGFALPGHPATLVTFGDSALVAVTLPPWSGEAPDQLPGAVVVSYAGRLDTIHEFRYRPEVTVRVEGQPRSVPRPFVPFPMLAGMRDDAAVVVGHDYEITFVVRQTTIRGPARRSRVRTRDKLTFAENIGDSALAAVLPFPRELPALRGLVGTADGVLLAKTYWERDKTIQWDRWRTNGQPMPGVLLPAGLRNVAAWGAAIYGVLTDQWGRQVVWVYEVSRSASCPGPVAALLAEDST